MNFCKNCGNKLSNGEKSCVNCGASVVPNPNNNVYVYSAPNNESYIEKNEKKTKEYLTLAIISLVLSLLPIVLLIWFIIATESGIPSGGSGVAVLLFVYYLTVGIPIAVSALVLGIVSYKKKKNILAIFSIFLDTIPYLYFIYPYVKY